MGDNRYFEFEIFETESEAREKTDNINNLLGYPNPKTETTTYRKLIKKYEADQWAGIVNDELVNACSEMTHEQKLPYYDENDLKSQQWLIDNDWYQPMTEQK